MLILADAHRRWYDSTDKVPDTGTKSVLILTLDENIQYIAEKELNQAIHETGAKAGTIIVENPNSGELLAIANWPTFNPNAAKDSDPEARIDRAASSLYEPGSVFKIVTLSGGDRSRPRESRTTLWIARTARSISLAIAFATTRPTGNLTVAQVLAVFERRRRDQDRPSPGRAKVFTTTSARSASGQPDRRRSARKGKAEAMLRDASKTGLRFPWARFPWGRKLASRRCK